VPAVDAPSVGDPAPEVALPRPDGTRWRLSDHRGRPVLLIFHRHLR
jgi:peroxiredoxin